MGKITCTKQIKKQKNRILVKLSQHQNAFRVSWEGQLASQNAIKLEQLEIDTCLLTHASGTNIWQVKIIPGECTVTVTSPYDECCQNLVFNTELKYCVFTCSAIRIDHPLVPGNRKQFYHTDLHMQCIFRRIGIKPLSFFSCTCTIGRA